MGGLIAHLFLLVWNEMRTGVKSRIIDWFCKHYIK